MGKFSIEEKDGKKYLVEEGLAEVKYELYESWDGVLYTNNLSGPNYTLTPKRGGYYEIKHPDGTEGTISLRSERPTAASLEETLSHYCDSIIDAVSTKFKHAQVAVARRKIEAARNKELQRKAREKIKAEQNVRKEEQRKQKEALKLKKQEKKEKLRAEKQAQKEKERAERLKLEGERLKQKATVGLEEEGGLGFKGEKEKHVKKGGILVPLLNREVLKWKFIAMAAGIPSVVAIATVLPLLILSKQKVPVPAVQTGGVIDDEPIPPTPPSPGPDKVPDVPPSPPEVVINENPIPPAPPSPGPVSGGSTIDTKGPDTPPTVPVPPTKVPLSPYGLYAQKDFPTIHRWDCYHINGLGEKDVIKFNSAGDAIASGGKPCDSCKPYILGQPLAPLSSQGIYSLKTSTYFHRGNCPRLSGVDTNDLIRFNNRIQAIKGGGRPCGLCKP